jgi:hypothetical protein
MNITFTGNHLIFNFHFEKEHLRLENKGSDSYEMALRAVEQTLNHFLYLTEDERAQFPQGLSQVYPAPIPPFRYDFYSGIDDEVRTFAIICGDEELCAISLAEAYSMKTLVLEQIRKASVQRGISFELIESIRHEKQITESKITML